MKVDKKKFILLGVGIFLVLILLVSATYAYFALNIVKNNSSTNINANTTAVDNIAIKKANDDLHLALSAEDMSLSNLGAYYATVDENNFEKDENIVSIAELTAVGGDVNASYNCQVKVTISPSSTDNMTSLLKEGDAEFYISYGDLLEKYDLYNLQTLNTKVFTGNILLINNSNDFVRAYIKVMNKEGDQSYLAGHNLNLDINTEIVSCDVVGQSKTELVLRNTSTSGTISKELKGGMYRYQGSADEVTDNYICFGTSDSQTCKEHQDQYMYRIIGVTPDGRIKVISQNSIKEQLDNGDFVTTFTINNLYAISDSESNYCSEFNCDDWPLSTLFKRLNGISDGTIKGPGMWGTLANSNIFIGTQNNKSYYDYMTIGSNWYNLIEDNVWLYGSENRESFVKLYDGDKMYAVETGKDDAQYYEIEKNTKNNVERNEKWQKKVRAKIGMLYFHDLFYTYTKNPVSDESYKNTWLDNKETGPLLFMTFASTWNGAHYGIWHISSDIIPYMYSLGTTASIRPVFYLNSNINISGNGTTADPYMIEL